MKLKDKQTILFIGDSITDCGRTRPVGAGDGLGEGYVAFADGLLSTWYPERQIRVLNTGVSGDRVIDLDARWQADMLDIAPNWLSVMIGINDVWRQFQFEAQPDFQQVTIDIYEKTYRKLLEKTRPRIDGLVLMTPYLIEADLSDPFRQRMDEYGEVVERLAHEFDAVFVDMQAAFDAYLSLRSAQSLADDRIHPNKAGHMIIARAFLTAVNFNWNITKK